MKGDPDPNDDILPPVKSIYRVLDEYPDIFEGYIHRREEASRHVKSEVAGPIYNGHELEPQTMFGNHGGLYSQPDNMHEVEFSPASNVQASEL